MKKYVAENGEVIIARDDVQAAAFEKAGFKLVEEEEKPKNRRAEEK